MKSENDLRGTSLVNHLMDQLNLPPNSALLISPIAASIIGLGVTAFCKHEIKNMTVQPQCIYITQFQSNTVIKLITLKNFN
ncbi:hypothetical protein [Candidatus Nitrosocosmicus arcticus]|uniref:Uncharacterized protein n=1 Tax=Candidatus Nitrosocosmicus arcticus TaxID=2035267 RepID=A0A557SZG5_9ARCH|nr:hypothetical protein [Candidatus Nitrosocosmicus arcticus]TVP41986.1 hypothetical protein NARC_10392 [Candidatus Nitrosocosmicus arcticus]